MCGTCTKIVLILWHFGEITKYMELRVSTQDTGTLVARHNDGQSVSMGHSSFDVKPQLGVTPNYFQGSRVPNFGGSCMRALCVTQSAVKKEADVPRGGLRTLDVIATEALLRFSITRNISKRDVNLAPKRQWTNFEGGFTEHLYMGLSNKTSILFAVFSI